MPLEGWTTNLMKLGCMRSDTKVVCEVTARNSTMHYHRDGKTRGIKVGSQGNIMHLSILITTLITSEIRVFGASHQAAKV
jgi:hypothetical protein